MIARIADLGDGWLPLGPTTQEIGEGIETLRTAFAERRRAPGELGVRVGLPLVLGDDGAVDVSASVASVPDLAAMGVTTVSVALGRFITTRADIEPFLCDMVDALAG